MKTEKSLLQRVQSRISVRRNAIREVNSDIELLVFLKSIATLPSDAKYQLTQLRKDARDMGVDQRTDKEVYQVLLEQERNKYAEYFRSSYEHHLADSGRMKAVWTKIILAVWLASHVAGAYAKTDWKVALGVSVLLGLTTLLAYQAGRGDEAWK